MKNKRAGFLIIEVLLAMVILSGIFLTLFSMISFVTNRTEKTKFDAQAAALMQEAVEVSRSSVLADWSDYPAGQYYPVYDADSDNWTLKRGAEGVLQGKFTRTLTIEKVCRDKNLEGKQVTCPGGSEDIRSKTINVKINWTVGTVQKEVKSQLLIFNK